MTQWNGLWILDKPAGMTSRAAVNRALGWLPRGTRLGHTGTLDPLATGVLVLCVGAATRLAEHVQAMPKVYEAGIVLGARSDTDDADGAITPSEASTPPSDSAVVTALQRFVGELSQTPPAYSAAKIGGRRAYDLARKGADLELAPRKVTIHGIDVVRCAYPRLDIVVRCGKGTYIRSLARDLGEALGCGGHIASLRRTQVGGFRVDDALTLEADVPTARGRLLPLSMAVSALPRRVLSAEETARARHGQALAEELPYPAGAEVALFDATGRFVAIACYNVHHRSLRPAKVMNEEHAT